MRQTIAHLLELETSVQTYCIFDNYLFQDHNARKCVGCCCVLLPAPCYTCRWSPNLAMNLNLCQEATPFSPEMWPFKRSVSCQG